jgi:hypothetical protein
MKQLKRDAKYWEMVRRAAELYHPCRCGIHVCGDKDGAAATFGNVPARDEAEARAMFEAAKAEAAVGPDEHYDLVVDLNLDLYNCHVEDFCITRQMLDRCLAAARAVAEKQEAE